MVLRNIVLIIMVLIASVSRLIPHPPNFTPIIAIGLFGGAYIKNRSLAVFIPIGAMFLSDLLLGLHGTIYWVYGSLLLVSILGMLLMNKVTIRNCVAAALSGSLFFFFITNFGVWLNSSYYAYNINGIITCYTLALPFLGNTLAGSLFYSAVMFGGYELLKWTVIQSAPESVQK